MTSPTNRTEKWDDFCDVMHLWSRISERATEGQEKNPSDKANLLKASDTRASENQLIRPPRRLRNKLNGKRNQ